MSLIAQMQRDRQQGEPDTRTNELPLFAAAEAIAASKRKRSSLLVLAPAILVPVLIIVAPVLVGNHFAKNSHVHAPDTTTVARTTAARTTVAGTAVASTAVASTKEVKSNNGVQLVAAPG
ncbi:MAG: hypothetical protein WBN40_10520, partial [Pseudomonadales bacterium]